MQVPGYELASEIPVSAALLHCHHALPSRPLQLLIVLSSASSLGPPFGALADPFRPAFPRPRQLGALFFIASAASLAVGAGGPMTYDRLMRRRTGFIYSGKTTQFVVWGICGLTISACVLLLVAGE